MATAFMDYYYNKASSWPGRGGLWPPRMVVWEERNRTAPFYPGDVSLEYYDPDVCVGESEPMDITFADMLADMQALYAGSDSATRMSDFVSDMQALYATSEMPIGIGDLIVDVRALYGDLLVPTTDLITDFQALYPIEHALTA